MSGKLNNNTDSASDEPYGGNSSTENIDNFWKNNSEQNNSQNKNKKDSNDKSISDQDHKSEEHSDLESFDDSETQFQDLTDDMSTLSLSEDLEHKPEENSGLESFNDSENLFQDLTDDMNTLSLSEGLEQQDTIDIEEHDFWDDMIIEELEKEAQEPSTKKWITVTNDESKTLNNQESSNTEHFQDQPLNEIEELLVASLTNEISSSVSSPENAHEVTKKSNAANIFVTLNGLDHLIQAITFYKKPSALNINFFAQQAGIIFDQYNAKTVFLKKTNDDKLEEIFSFYDSGNENDPEAYKIWLDYREQHLERLLLTKTPSWIDKNFQTEQQEFVFPFYDGQKFLGLAVALFNGAFAQADARKVEIIIETCRGLYLDPTSIHPKATKKEAS